MIQITEHKDLELRNRIVELEFNSVEEFFMYIMESRANGQHTQARELFNGLSEGMQGQMAAFFRWVEETFYYDAENGELQDQITELKRYFNYK